MQIPRVKESISSALVRSIAAEQPPRDAVEVEGVPGKMVPALEVVEIPSVRATERLLPQSLVRMGEGGWGKRVARRFWAPTVPLESVFAMGTTKGSGASSSFCC